MDTPVAPILWGCADETAESNTTSYYIKSKFYYDELEP